MATKKQPVAPETPEVINKIVMRWYDEDGNVKEHIKRLKRPKGTKARVMLPKVLKFVSGLAKHEQKLEGEDIFEQMEMIEEFFTAENEALFAFILQLENDEMHILENELSPGETLRVVSEAAGFIISQSFDRPEVQEALKKSAGEEQKEAE